MDTRKLRELESEKARLYEELERVGKQQKALTKAVHEVQRAQKKELEQVEEFVSDDPLSHEDVRRWASTVFWQFARTMAANPHEYAHERWCDQGMFDRIVKFIWENGYDRQGFGRLWRSLDVADHYLWVCTRPGPDVPAPVEETILINRAPLTTGRREEAAERELFDVKEAE